MPGATELSGLNDFELEEVRNIEDKLLKYRERLRVLSSGEEALDPLTGVAVCTRTGRSLGSIQVSSSCE